jgi:hypothetical protein
MWGVVLLFAFNAGQDPLRIGIVVLLISRPRSMPNLLAYWLGLMAMGFGGALAALFLLRGFLLPFMRVVASATAHPAIPAIQIGVGVVALSIAAMLAAPPSVRQAAYALVPGGGSSVEVLQPKTPTVFSRLSWRRLLENESPKMAFVAGLFTGTPPVEFWGAIMVILASGAGTGARVIAALMFALVAYAVVEIPLVSYLASPTKTQAVAMRLHDWLHANRRPIFVFVLGAFGVWMVLNGVGRV